jgi:hypothetical protein
MKDVMPAVQHQKTVGTKRVHINGIDQIQEIKQKKHRIEEGKCETSNTITKWNFNSLSLCLKWNCKIEFIKIYDSLK